jgi:hypothetical protein
MALVRSHHGVQPRCRGSRGISAARSPAARCSPHLCIVTWQGGRPRHPVHSHVAKGGRRISAQPCRDCCRRCRVLSVRSTLQMVAASRRGTVPGRHGSWCCSHHGVQPRWNGPWHQCGRAALLQVQSSHQCWLMLLAVMPAAGTALCRCSRHQRTATLRWQPCPASVQTPRCRYDGGIKATRCQNNTWL